MSQKSLNHSLHGRVRNRERRGSGTKEVVIRQLWKNAQRGAQVQGGSVVTNRALELLGKELGMFKEPEVKPPMTLEELSKQPPEALQAMLEEAEKQEVAAVDSGDGKPPKTVN